MENVVFIAHTFCITPRVQRDHTVASCIAIQVNSPWYHSSRTPQEWACWYNCTASPNTSSWGQEQGWAGGVLCTPTVSVTMYVLVQRLLHGSFNWFPNYNITGWVAIELLCLISCDHYHISYVHLADSYLFYHFLWFQSYAAMELICQVPWTHTLPMVGTHNNVSWVWFLKL